MDTCPLCQHKANEIFYKDKHREYTECPNCKLIFALKKFWPNPAKEKEKYDLHQNSPDNQGYRDFLGKMYEAINKKIKAPAVGLDFGSGPGPTLSVIFEENGYEMELFDPYYKNTPEVLNCHYDFITCTEVLEHMFNPSTEIKKLLHILPKGGVLGIMTQMVISKERFKTWWYKNDLTHVCFYSKETFNWLGLHFGVEIEFIGNDIVLLIKKSAGT